MLSRQLFIHHVIVDKAYLTASTRFVGIKEWSLGVTKPATDTSYVSDWGAFRRTLSVNGRDLVLCVACSSPSRSDCRSAGNSFPGIDAAAGPAANLVYVLITEASELRNHATLYTPTSKVGDLQLILAADMSIMNTFRIGLDAIVDARPVMIRVSRVGLKMVRKYADSEDAEGETCV